MSAGPLEPSGVWCHLLLTSSFESCILQLFVFQPFQSCILQLPVCKFAICYFSSWQPVRRLFS